MDAFIVNLQKFFMLDTGNEHANFNHLKKHLRIPLYQREFKWTDEKISTLFSDIKSMNKFLGIVILDEGENEYEIVDGQQRITVFYLIMIGLYNHYVGSPLSQQSIINHIKAGTNEYTLVNDSIGTSFFDSNGKIELNITDTNDVYFQKANFKRAFELIANLISELGDNVAVEDFRRKLMACELLILINDQNPQTNPIEQVFLDINEKSQLLDVEDIFKGHCFENYASEMHQILRQKWIELKKTSFLFKKFHFVDLNQYLYLFLLFCEEPKLQKNLTIRGKHILDGKSMDETNSILCQLNSFGNAIIQLETNLRNTEYRFSDISPHSHEYRMTDDHIILKDMAASILLENDALYQKLPFMFFVYVLGTQADTRNTMTHLEFRKIVTNLYVYASMFVAISGRKSKENIERDLFEALRTDPCNVSAAIENAKTLRKKEVDDFYFSDKMPIARLYSTYSIMDNYIASDNWINLIYTRENGFTPEHFIIPDNRKMRLKWKLEDQVTAFELASEYRSFKNRTINFLILDKHLNESIEVFDIATKISMIKEWYASREISIPKHVQVYIRRIEAMDEYAAIVDLKRTHCNDLDTIAATYQQFILAYFDAEQEAQYLLALRQAFRETFMNVQ